MTGAQARDTSDGSMSTARLVLLVAAGTAVVVGVGSAFTLVSLHWPLGEVYFQVMGVTMVVTMSCVLIWNPVVIKRRMWPGAGLRTWDIVLILLLMPTWIAVYVAAGLDGRDWVSGSPGGEWYTGLALHVAGFSILTWAMVKNPFFEKMVRIQTDNDHRVIDRGPYAFVRHPGYVGFSLWILSTPLLLASSWAFLPAGLTVVAFVVRTALEDRMLQAELHGYADYAAKTRYRLIPGVW